MSSSKDEYRPVYSWYELGMNGGDELTWHKSLNSNGNGCGISGIGDGGWIGWLWGWIGCLDRIVKNGCRLVAILHKISAPIY